eukprot:4268155-Amphidinium_carterae.1
MPPGASCMDASPSTVRSGTGVKNSGSSRMVVLGVVGGVGSGVWTWIAATWRQVAMMRPDPRQLGHGGCLLGAAVHSKWSGRREGMAVDSTVHQRRRHDNRGCK